MKVFLSALESTPIGNRRELAKYLIDNGIHLKWNLMSYYYIGNNMKLAEYIRDNSENILIDSGAHSFQKGKKVEWNKYTDDYANFIKNFDNEKVLGYFEMDVDNIIGYENVLKIRKKLEKVTDKIIPVWHKNRGVNEYKKMCEDYAGKIVAITGLKNGDIKDEQYLMFLKYAKKYDCKVHCLGMTRKKVLDKVPFDFVDSSSWVQDGVYGKIGKKGKVTKQFSKQHRDIIMKENYLIAEEMQEYYYNKWKKVCKD